MVSRRGEMEDGNKGNPSLSYKTRGQRAVGAPKPPSSWGLCPTFPQCCKSLASLWAECSSTCPTRPLTLGFRKQRARKSQHMALSESQLLRRKHCLPRHSLLMLFSRNVALPAATQSSGLLLRTDNSPRLALRRLVLSLFVGFIIFVTGGATRNGLCLQGDLTPGGVIRGATVLPTTWGKGTFIPSIFLNENLF